MLGELCNGSPYPKPHPLRLPCVCVYLVVGFSPSWWLFQDGPNRTGTTRALDCGAGIGRITKRLLLPLFKTVDMVDVTEDFLTKAKSYLGEEGRRVRNYFCCGLQDFSPEPNTYDVIWIQWVIGEGLFITCPLSSFPQGAPCTGESSSRSG